MTHLDLFSGIGGFSLAAEACGFRTVAFCELDTDASLVLSHWWPGVPNYKDVKELNGCTVKQHGPIDLLTAGVPCQAASLIGARRGTSDERWLWPDTIRIVGELRPRICVFENPPAILTLEGGRAFNGIVSGLAALGYDLWWDVIPAAAVGAGHKRERLFIVCADSDSARGQKHCAGIHAPAIQSGQDATNGTQRLCEVPHATHADQPGLEGHTGHGPRDEGQGQERPVTEARIRPFSHDLTNPDWWKVEPGVCALVNGLPARLVEAALRCCGNAVVPQVAEAIIRGAMRL